MTHPDELLADYVDGSLGNAARAEVETHLVSCERCRSDLRAAQRARDALREAPDARAPADLRAHVVSSLPERTGSAGVWSIGAAREQRHTPLAVWLGGAAAALLIGIFAFGGLFSSGGGGTPASGGADALAPHAAESAGAAADGSFLAQPNIDYDEAGIERLAATALTGKPPAAAPAQGTSGDRDAGDAAAAAACLTQGAEIGETDRPIQLIEARFDGKPAYLGVYRVPASGEAPERVVVWVVSRRDCSVLSFTQRLAR
jgi:hypothetical protein